MIESLTDLLISDEGMEVFPYTDTTGHRTWGVGHNLDASPLSATAIGFMHVAAKAQLQADLGVTLTYLEAFSWWKLVDPVRQAAIADMAFNLGNSTFATFVTFIGCLARLDYPAAAADLRTTLVYQQLPGRYTRLAEMLESGAWPQSD